MQSVNLIGTMLLALALSACNTTGPYSSSAGELDNSNLRSGYGTVESVAQVDPANVGVLGTIGGAVIGGLLGHQIGSGRGQTAATIAGAAGGAYAGNEIERRSRAGGNVYKIYVRMDDGSVQAVVQETQPVVRTGDRVRIYNGAVTPI
ncbi:MAG: glycine zipper 2TM domain-containing protein [Betaproteobacteria bacterium]|nr:MAG: glycine zipper 2TM domain-containing protein [Betaproteobacteria bacterium]